MAKVIYCPVNGWDCPYFDANGCCMLYPEFDPIDECDDFAVFWDKGDDYICDTEKDGDFFDNCDCDMGFDPYLGCYTDDC
jgi:hypothetical protein